MDLDAVAYRIGRAITIPLIPFIKITGFVSEHALTPREQDRLIERLRRFRNDLKAATARRVYERQHDALLHEFLNTPKDHPKRADVESRIHDMALMGDPYWIYVSRWLKSGKHPDEFAKEMGL